MFCLSMCLEVAWHSRMQYGDYIPLQTKYQMHLLKYDSFLK